MTAPTPATPAQFPTPVTSKRRRRPGGSTQGAASRNDDGDTGGQHSPSQIRTLMERAQSLRATLFVTTTGALVIQRGTSSWHCCDCGSADAVLRRLESSR